MRSSSSAFSGFLIDIGRRPGRDRVRLKRGLTALAAAIILNGVCAGQGIEEYSGRSFGGGARASALAETFMADAYDVTSMYWNPSTLAFLQNYSLVMNHATDLSSGMMIESIASPFKINRGEVISVGLIIHHRGYLQSSPSPSEFRVVEYGYDLAYAQELLPTLAMGARVDVRYGRGDLSNLWAISASLGFFYSPSQEVSYGAALNDIGSCIQYSSDGAMTLLQTMNLHRSLEVGATMRYPFEFKKPILTLAIANEKVFTETGLIYKGGVEWLPTPSLALRVGYIYRTDPALGSTRYGLGIVLGRFRLDYATAPSHLTDRTYDVSLAIGFW